MDEKFEHAILIVDDEENVGKAAQRILKDIDAKLVYVLSGEEGLAIMEKRHRPFSIIISDERMPGMRGHEFLQKAKQISPDSLRYLITGYSNRDAIVNAVNKGAIHRYIAKPWDRNHFVKTVVSGLKKYEQRFENEHLMREAKKKSEELYAMNYDLIRSSRQHKKKIDAFNKKIESLNKAIAALKKSGLQRVNFGEKAVKRIRDKNWMNPDMIHSLYIETMKELFEQFYSIAERHEIEFPGQS